MQTALLKNALSQEDLVPPLLYHVDEQIVTLQGERLVSVIRLEGMSYETSSEEALEKSFEGLNLYFLSMGKKEGDKLAIHTYVMKNRIHLNDNYTFENQFFQNFANEYTDQFRGGEFYEVNYALVLVLKYDDLTDGIKRMKELLRLSEKSLEQYDAAVMGIGENKHGVMFSEPGQFFSRIYNGYEMPVLLSDTRMSDAVVDSIIHFGAFDFIEVRPNKGGKRYAVTYDLRDYPAKSTPGMWDDMLEEPYEFVFMQAFRYIPRNEAKTKLSKHANDLIAADGETDQVRELYNAKEGITDDKLAFGSYTAALIVYGNTQKLAVDNGSRLTSVFINRDTTFVRSTLTNVYTWFAQFPGARQVIYEVLKSTENVACGFSLHAMPGGKQYGNPPGDGTALIPLINSKGGLHFFNAHYSSKGQNNNGEMYAGHMTLLGQSGTGKTTFLAALAGFFSRWQPMIFAIDYNRSMDNFLRVLGTKYFVLQAGSQTGLQPFQLPDSTRLRSFLYQLVTTCVGGATDEEQSQIKQAVDAVMMHSESTERRFSLLLQMVPIEEGNSLHMRLRKWCAATHGIYAWVLDAPVNQFYPENHTKIAFDATEILNKEFARENPLVTESILATLFFFKDEMHQQGGFLMNLVEEFWVPVSFPSTADRIKDILKAGRMRNEFIILSSQSPEDALAVPIAAAIIQQTVTQVFLPNDKAEWDSYQRCGLTAREFELLRDLGRFSRKFLIKQSWQSLIACFDLHAFKQYLPVLSTTEKNVLIADRVRQELNTEDPLIWLPVFLEEVAASVYQHC